MSSVFAALMSPLEAQELGRAREAEARVARLRGGVVPAKRAEAIFCRIALQALGPPGSCEPVWSILELRTMRDAKNAGCTADEVAEAICAFSPGAITQDERGAVEMEVNRQWRPSRVRGRG